MDQPPLASPPPPIDPAAAAVATPPHPSPALPAETDEDAAVVVRLALGQLHVGGAGQDEFVGLATQVVGVLGHFARMPSDFLLLWHQFVLLCVATIRGGVASGNGGCVLVPVSEVDRGAADPRMRLQQGGPHPSARSLSVIRCARVLLAGEAHVLSESLPGYPQPHCRGYGPWAKQAQQAYGGDLLVCVNPFHYSSTCCSPDDERERLRYLQFVQSAAASPRAAPATPCSSSPSAACAKAATPTPTPVTLPPLPWSTPSSPSAIPEAGGGSGGAFEVLQQARRWLGLEGFWPLVERLASTDGVSLQRDAPSPPPPHVQATYVRDLTLPDGSLVMAGTLFRKEWLVHNSGSVAWPSDTKVVNCAGEEVPVGAVPAGHVGTVAVVDVAPEDVGPGQAWYFDPEAGQPVFKASTSWTLSTGGQAFGPKLWSLFRVYRGPAPPDALEDPRPEPDAPQHAQDSNADATAGDTTPMAMAPAPQGPQARISPIAGPSTCPPGMQFSVSLLVRNTGQAPWPPSSMLQTSGIVAEAFDAAAGAAAVGGRWPELVVVGELTSSQHRMLRIPIQAPAIPGNYSMKWTLLPGADGEGPAMQQRQGGEQPAVRIEFVVRP